MSRPATLPAVEPGPVRSFVAPSPRPREKLRTRGPAELTECELLALMLGSGTA